MYTREAVDRYQNLVSAAYGSAVNPSQNPNGTITFENPYDAKPLATVAPGQDGEPSLEHVIWVEGVEYDGKATPKDYRGWAAYTNTTKDNHVPTPDDQVKAEEGFKEPEDGDDAWIDALNTSASDTDEAIEHTVVQKDSDVAEQHEPGTRPVTDESVVTDETVQQDTDESTGEGEDAKSDAPVEKDTTGTKPSKK